jgi:hypothetical protein
MDDVKSEPDSDGEVYQYPISFQEDFEFVNMRDTPSVWREIKVCCI